MSSLAQRKYVFRRRPIWGRALIAAVVLAGTVFVLMAQKADAMPGGYRPEISTEKPA